MLSAEAAQAALAERRERSTLTAARGRVTGLATKAVAGSMSDPRADRAKLVSRLDKLGRRGRRLAVAAALPGLGGELASLYEGAGALTYQGSWDRRPFRAPRTQQLAQERVLNTIGRTVPELVAHAADPVWLARWAGHLTAQSWAVDGHTVGWLLAAAIDGGNDEVFDILLATIDGSDEIATMGRHVPIALLCAGREAGWERVEQLLLSAQRQEGLRQSILEVADEARPQALRRMLALILEHDLSRFSSVARAVAVWFGVEVLAGERRRIDELIRATLGYLERPPATVGEDPPAAYLALWARATNDVQAAIAQAEPLLDAPDPELRFAAAYLLGETKVTMAFPALLRALGDDDLRVAAVACWALASVRGNRVPESYDAIEALLARVPKRAQELQPVSWLGPLPALKRETVAELLFGHVDPPHVDRVLPHAKALDTWTRGRLVGLVANGPQNADRRAALLGFLSDTSPEVRGHAIAAMRTLELTDEEAIALEPLLKRKPGDLRRGVLELISARGDAWMLDAAQRLLDGDEQQRLAAVDLLRRVAAGESAHAGRGRDALAQVDAADATVVGDASRRAVADDPLTRPERGRRLRAVRRGRSDRAGRAAAHGLQADTPAALRVIALLDGLIEAHAEVEILGERWGSRERVLLGAATFLHLRQHDVRLRSGETDVELPLRELWTGFAASLPAARAMTTISSCCGPTCTATPRRTASPGTRRRRWRPRSARATRRSSRRARVPRLRRARREAARVRAGRSRGPAREVEQARADGARLALDPDRAGHRPRSRGAPLRRRLRRPRAPPLAARALGVRAAGHHADHRGLGARASARQRTAPATPARRCRRARAGARQPRPRRTSSTISSGRAGADGSSRRWGG